MNFLEPALVDEFENYFVVYKPPGWFVHPPSDKRGQIAFKNKIVTQWFQKHFKKKYFPVHRLDFGTEGLLLWAKDEVAAARLGALIASNSVEKCYQAVARGYFEPENGCIDFPLVSDHAVSEKECRTDYKTLKRLELPVQINSRFPTSRYSLMEVRLGSGRWHQIRRHFDQVAHPIIGDQEHGDSHHNRYFRDHLHIEGLLLRAYSLKWQDPFNGQTYFKLTPTSTRWEAIDKLFT